MEVRIGKRYTMGKKLGSGSFGDIYLGVHIDTGVEVAIKLEPSNSKFAQLHAEGRVYHILEGGTGVPRVHYEGTAGRYNVLVIDLLGKSLEDLFVDYGRPFRVKTVLQLADQLLERIEYVHSRGLIHRDIKPDNFLMGRGNSASSASMVFVIDFGLSKRYKDPKSGHHIPFRDNKSLTGTPRYASINNHMGLEQSRRDDLESLGYVFLYFLRGKLPWQGLKADNKKEKYRRIMDRKKTTPLDDLCKGFPTEFKTYLQYCRGLGFTDRPDYAYLRGLMKEAATRNNIVFDGVFDWMGSSGTHRSRSSHHSGQHSGRVSSSRPHSGRHKSAAGGEHRHSSSSAARRASPGMPSSSRQRGYGRSSRGRDSSGHGASGAGAGAGVGPAQNGSSSAYWQANSAAGGWSGAGTSAAVAGAATNKTIAATSTMARNGAGGSSAGVPKPPSGTPVGSPPTGAAPAAAAAAAAAAGSGSGAPASSGGGASAGRYRSSSRHRRHGEERPYSDGRGRYETGASGSHLPAASGAVPPAPSPHRVESPQAQARQASRGHSSSRHMYHHGNGQPPAPGPPTPRKSNGRYGRTSSRSGRSGYGSAPHDPYYQQSAGGAAAAAAAGAAGGAALPSISDDSRRYRARRELGGSWVR